jgi:Transglutaminase-like superfamily
MLRMVRRVLRLPLAGKLLLFETLVALALARVAVLLLPFRWVARVLGRQEVERDALDHAVHVADARQIAIMVHKAIKNVPWTSKCLDQALAAKVMLARRGISTTVYFGVKSDEQGQLAAHAWLRSGEIYVTGGRNRDEFTPISVFTDRGA